jgi:hypothetical protein
MSDDDLLKIRNFGDKSLEELRQKLAERGITAYPRSLPESSGEGVFLDEPISPTTIADLPDQDLDRILDDEDEFGATVLRRQEVNGWPDTEDDQDDEDEEDF